jgi:hypothetical protein
MWDKVDTNAKLVKHAHNIELFNANTEKLKIRVSKRQTPELEGRQKNTKLVMQGIDAGLYRDKFE